VRADGNGVARVDLGELVNDDDVRQVIHPRPTEVLRPRDPEQAKLRHLFDVVPGKAAVEIVFPGGGLDDGSREIADHLADLEMVVGEVQRVVHRRNIGGRGGRGGNESSALAEVFENQLTVVPSRFHIATHER
jgi:hypothetical protein